jgi:uncharacterized cupredoxin-like copper-binding protein
MARTRASAVRFALTVSAVLLTASCSAPSASPSVSPRLNTASSRASPGRSGGATVEVTLKDFSITVPEPSSAGAISFHVANQGTMVHEFDIYKSSLPLDGLPTNSSQQVDDGSPMVEVIEASVPIPPGTSVTIVATLASGHYYFVCNQPGHYKLGMRLEYVVG